MAGIHKLLLKGKTLGQVVKNHSIVHLNLPVEKIHDYIQKCSLVGVAKHGRKPRWVLQYHTPAPAPAHLVLMHESAPAAPGLDATSLFDSSDNGTHTHTHTPAIELLKAQQQRSATPKQQRRDPPLPQIHPTPTPQDSPVSPPLTTAHGTSALSVGSRSDVTAAALATSAATSASQSPVDSALAGIAVALGGEAHRRAPSPPPSEGFVGLQVHVSVSKSSVVPKNSATNFFLCSAPPLVIQGYFVPFLLVFVCVRVRAHTR